MTQRKPLVIVNGEIQQLQSGDSIAQEEDAQFTADAAMIAGQVVYMTAADHIGKAKADAAGTAQPIGLCNSAISNGAVGPVQTGGIITLTTTQWDAVFGTTGGLAFNAPYFLSAGTAGIGTATPPSTVGQYVIQLGVALSTTEFQINIQQRVLL